MQTVTFMPSPNFWAGRFGAKPRYIILHGTAGGTSAQNIAKWFENPSSQVSAHYIIGQDGTVVCCVKEEDTAWGNGPISGPSGTSGDRIHHDAWWDASPALSGYPNPNLITISIEHVKPHDDNSDPLTPAQQAASFGLINDICDKWGIPKRKADALGGITGHFSMDPANRSDCPGNYDWDSLWRDLGANPGPISAGVPQGWTDDGKTLTAPNGIPVVMGFRQYILDPKNQWSAGNWPIEAEHGQSPLEISNPDYGSGSQQLFRWTMLGYTQQHGVFAEWIGEELLAYRAEVAKLKASAPH
ncbi:MAG TPA: peptidoglycan recognition family protein [Ktedonosporobacter sp.]|nr:peptidoglycan recognition family protein [Ktedonosporobacter sp.]